MGGGLWLMPSADVNQNSSTETDADFLHLLKIWPSKLAVSCLVCTDGCFGLAVRHKCAYLRFPYARPSRRWFSGFPPSTAAWTMALQCKWGTGHWKTGRSLNQPSLVQCDFRAAGRETMSFQDHSWLLARWSCVSKKWLPAGAHFTYFCPVRPGSMSFW